MAARRKKLRWSRLADLDLQSADVFSRSCESDSGVEMLACVFHGFHQAQALHLFETQKLTLGQGAQLAGLSLEEFLELLRRSHLAAVSYPPEDLADEIEAAR